MEYDPGFFDEDENRVEPAGNPIIPKVLPMCPGKTREGWWAREDLTGRLRLAGPATVKSTMLSITSSRKGVDIPVVSEIGTYFLLGGD